MLKNRKVYESNLEGQLAQWQADIDVLKAKAKRAEVQAAIEYDKTIDALQRQHSEARQHLANLRRAGDDTWEDIKASTDTAWKGFKALFQSSTSRS